MSSCKNWNTVVCGGSSGLGLWIATELVRRQAQSVVLLGRDLSRLNEAQVALREVAQKLNSSTRIELISADLCDAISAGQAADRIRQLIPELDLVVQCVGASDRGPISQLSRQKLMELIDANTVSSLHAIQSFAPLLVKRKGAIGLIGSLSSLFAPRYLGGYSIAKHALAGLAQQSRLELKDSGVHVMLCCPGPINRPDAGSRYDEKSSEGLPREALKPGGGAKVKRLDPAQLAIQILDAALRRKPILILPRKACWLRIISALSQSLGDRLLRMKST